MSINSNSSMSNTSNSNSNSTPPQDPKDGDHHHDKDDPVVIEELVGKTLLLLDEAEELKAALQSTSYAKQRLLEKKDIAMETISQQIGYLHTILDEWRDRLIETSDDTLEEKIGALGAQAERQEAHLQEIDTLANLIKTHLVKSLEYYDSHDSHDSHDSFEKEDPCIVSSNCNCNSPGYHTRSLDEHPSDSEDDDDDDHDNDSGSDPNHHYNDNLDTDSAHNEHDNDGYFIDNICSDSDSVSGDSAHSIGNTSTDSNGFGGDSSHPKYTTTTHFNTNNHNNNKELLHHLDEILKKDRVLQPVGINTKEVTETNEEISQGLRETFDGTKNALDNALSYTGGIVRCFQRRGNANPDYTRKMKDIRLVQEIGIAPQFAQEYRSLVDRTFNSHSYDIESQNKICDDVLSNQPTAWDVVCNLFASRSDLSKVKKHCNRLVCNFGRAEIDFYFPHLCNILLCMDPKTIASKKANCLWSLLKDACRASVNHKLTFYLQAKVISETNPPTASQVEMANALMAKLEHLSANSGDNLIFRHQLDFMQQLVEISRMITSIASPDKKEQLKTILSSHYPTLTAEGISHPSHHPESHNYIPICQSLNNDLCHHIARIPLSEVYTIPTYGRVLYYMVAELLEFETGASWGGAIEEEDDDDDDEMDGSGIGDGSEVARESNVEAFIEIPRNPHLLSSLLSSVPPPSETHDLLQLSSLHDPVPSPSSSTHERDDSVFGETFKTKYRRLRETSPLGSLPNWRIKNLIVKHGDQVQQEQFVMQLMVQVQRIFLDADLPLKLFPYRILPLSQSSGLIEFVPDTINLDKLKKTPGFENLTTFFYKEFGSSREKFALCLKNFTYTLAASCVFSYILQIKDRHNANLILDNSGNMINIDFGFMLSRSVDFERTPFRLTEEFVEVMGGSQSKCFKQFKKLCVQGYLAIRREYKQIINLMEIAVEAGWNMPCLDRSTIKDVLSRFHLEWTEDECRSFFYNLIAETRKNWRTSVFDTYMHVLNGIQI